ncbi:MAG TPA: hypothetical protein VHU80_05990, partial [Polyangiaceae bacterium]|nr:hypothetical protein [Polyangiaceae bacterium]
GLVLRLGAGPGTAYRAVTKDELEELASEREDDGTDELVWAIIYREGPLSRDALAKLVRHADLEASIARLVTSGRVRTTQTTGTPAYVADRFFVPEGAAVGWEAAMFDHFQAVVKTLASRLRGPEPATGGSTYSFDVWEGHPLETEVLALLPTLRERTSSLRARVRAYNEAHPRPLEYQHVTFYGGQCVVREEEASEI